MPLSQEGIPAFVATTAGTRSNMTAFRQLPFLLLRSTQPAGWWWKGNIGRGKERERGGPAPCRSVRRLASRFPFPTAPTYYYYLP